MGSLFALGPFGLLTDAEKLSWPLRILISSLGAASVGAGLWVLAGAPLSRLRVDRAAGKLRLDRWGLAGRFAREWPLGAALAVRLVEGRGEEDGEIFQIHLVLRGEQPIPVSPVWHHGREPIELVAHRLAEALDVKVLSEGLWAPKVHTLGA